MNKFVDGCEWAVGIGMGGVVFVSSDSSLRVLILILASEMKLSMSSRLESGSSSTLDNSTHH